MKKEIEAKFINVNKEEIRKKLKSLGGKLIKPETLMLNRTFDFPNAMTEEGIYKWIRVRDEGNKITMTLKLMTNWEKIDGVNEVEITVDDFYNACEFLITMGFVDTNESEKYREIWDFNKAEVVIDTWPGLEPLIEIEADSEEKVMETAEKLGFDYSKAVFGSADLVYERVYNLPANSLTSFKKITFESFHDELKNYLETHKQH